MTSIAAGEIKRRGISAVDESLRSGPVQVIQRNEIRYVVLSMEQFNDLQTAHEEAMIARVRAAQNDVAAGQFQRMTARDLIDDLGE